MSDHPIEPSKPTVNHDRSGLWAPDPLEEFSSERPASISPATPLPTPNKRVKLRPPVRRAESRRGSLALVDPARKGLWSFASGSALGALVCVIVVSWLTTSEQPRAEQIARAAERVSQSPATPPVSAVPETPTVAERAMPVVSGHPGSPLVEKTRSTDTTKRTFVGSLRIDSTPQGARVFIDRQAAGVTPLVVSDVSAGSHAVRVEADNQLPWSSAIRVVADRQTRVHTTLAPLDNAPHRR